MSVKTSSRVWEYSPEKGSNLLALLAIADHADDYGVAWPGMDRIAKKARVTKRHAKRIVQNLQDSGEVYIITGGGRGHSNRYFISSGLSGEQICAILTQHEELKLSPVEAEIAVEIILKRREKVTQMSPFEPEKGDTDDTVSEKKRVTPASEKGDTAMSPEPSVTVNKPPREPPESRELSVETEIELLTRYGRESPGIADPNQDLKQWFKYGDDALQAFEDNGGFLGKTRRERQGRKDEILKLAQESNFDLQKWRNSVHTCIILGGVANDNLGCMIDTYRDGGDYSAMMEKRRHNNGKGGNARDGPHRPVSKRDAGPGAGRRPSSLTEEQRRAVGLE